MNEVLDITQLKAKLNQFAEERDWEQFHSPKNLSMALSVEASELLEIFQWMPEEKSRNLQDQNLKTAISDELADIILYATRLADQLNISLADAIDSKFESNVEKYPIDKVKGSSKKYNTY